MEILSYTHPLADFFKKNRPLGLDEINRKIKKISGIHSFFSSQKERDEAEKSLNSAPDRLAETSKIEYGDFQTNPPLAETIVRLLKDKNIHPEIIVESTCGKGNFILASLHVFKDIKYIGKFCQNIPGGFSRKSSPDTCYYVGFDSLRDAAITRFLLNKPVVTDFLKSVSFSGAKRVVTKDLLMRIDLAKVVANTTFEEIKQNIPYVSEKDWKNYSEKIKTPVPLSIFDMGDKVAKP